MDSHTSNDPVVTHSIPKSDNVNSNSVPGTSQNVSDNIANSEMDSTPVKARKPDPIIIPLPLNWREETDKIYNDTLVEFSTKISGDY